MPELAELEREMSRLCARRDMRVRIAQGEIAQANRDFDKAALPLGRKINKLRAQIEAAQQPEPKSQTARSHDNGHVDPEWTDEDQAHFRELKRAANAR